MTWLLSQFSGIKLWLYAFVAAAFAALLGYAKLEEHEKRKAQDGAAAHDAEQDAATAQAQASRIQTRSEVDARVQAIPKPAVDAQPVAVPAVGSAVDELRADWSRDQAAAK